MSEQTTNHTAENGLAYKDLIKPFQAKQIPARGSQLIPGAITKRTDHMGFAGMGQKEFEEQRDVIQERLQWDIAHKNYMLLKPCVSITGEYQPNEVPYSIDVFGDGDVTKTGGLLVTPGDFHYQYMKMQKIRRRDTLLERIAICSVGLLVPYITITSMSLSEDGTLVFAEYEIGL